MAKTKEGPSTLAIVEVVQLSSQLVPIPGTVATGDTITNSTCGLLSLCVGVQTAQGRGKVILLKEGTIQEVQPGATSGALTFGAGEGAYIYDNNRTSNGSTIDAIAVPLA